MVMKSLYQIKIKPWLLSRKNSMDFDEFDMLDNPRPRIL